MQHLDLNWADDWAGWPQGEYCVKIPTLQAGRRALGPASDSARIARSRVYWQQSQMRSRGRLRLGMHDRGEEYLLADGAIHETDLDGHRNHLPLHVGVICQPEIRIERGQTLDLTASHTWWPELDDREELYVVLDVDRLIVEPGARLQVRGNICVCNIGHLIAEAPGRSGPLGSPQFEMAIRGTDHAAFSLLRDEVAQDGRKGPDGLDGRDAREPKPEPSIFGPLPSSDTLHEAATDGQDGTDGRDGTHGQNGGLAMVADIRIKQLTGFGRNGLRVFGQASPGHAGGAGGDGGKGGDGGSGRTHAARGGAGGAGGNGGHGGHGGLAGNIFVELPCETRALVEACSLDSLGGAAGRGGLGGKAGRDGEVKGSGKPACVRTARSGRNGREGRPGRSRPGPCIHLLESAERPEPDIVGSRLRENRT